MEKDCFEVLKACPGDTVTFEKDCSNATCFVSYDGEVVEGSFTIGDEIAILTVDVFYTQEEGGSCRVVYSPPDGPQVATCFEQQPGQEEDSKEKIIECGGGQ